MEESKENRGQHKWAPFGLLCKEAGVAQWACLSSTRVSSCEAVLFWKNGALQKFTAWQRKENLSAQVLLYLV